MILALLNESPEVSDADFITIAGALRKHAARVRAEHPGEPVEVLFYAARANVPVGALVLHVQPDGPEQGVLAFHSVTNAGTPYEMVYAKRAEGLFRGPRCLAVLMAHEVGETMANPMLTRAAKRPDGVVIAYEIQDPLQATTYLASVDGTFVDLPAFATRAYYEDGSAGPWDSEGVLPGPFTYDADGYANVIANDGSVSQEFGANGEPRTSGKGAVIAKALACWAEIAGTGPEAA